MAFDYNSGLAALASIASAIGKGYQANRQGNAQEQAVKNQQEAYNLQKLAYEKQAALTPAQISQKILELKQPLSADMKRVIMQDIGNAMAASGAFSSPGIIQEAIARALATADVNMLETATNAYFANQADTQRAMPQAQQMPYFTGSGKGGAFDPLVDLLSSNPDALTNMFKPKPVPTATAPPVAEPAKVDWGSGVAYD